MSNAETPELSVVIVTPDRYETVRESVRHLRAQTVKAKLEIVLVAPSRDRLDPNNLELEGFSRSRIVEVGPLTSSAKARMAGIHEASAPVIAFVEDHSFPDPGWAEALIEAHRHPWAAVGPVIRNANPGSLTSWTNLLIEYGPWLDPAEGKSVNHLPGHNSSYKRAVLLEYGPEVEAMIEAETVLHWDLRAKGYQLYLEPAARTDHLNFSSLFSSLSLRFCVGRLFASTRSRHGSPLRRLLYLFGAPLIPLVRLARIWRELCRPGRPQQLLPRILPSLITALIVDGAGEMTGYALGMGRAAQKVSDMEFHRIRHLNRRDKDTFQSRQSISFPEE